MKIEYIHASNPYRTKIHDTEKVRKNTFHNIETQKYVDDLTLGLLKRDAARGVILYYKIVTEAAQT